ncbi:hypothetical protein B7494_g6430 [Chlorociboria aeruginascens]|nr:hypothetical protein B7494_g6430 [Chlorociboria aeruginascens]
MQLEGAIPFFTQSFLKRSLPSPSSIFIRKPVFPHLSADTISHSSRPSPISRPSLLLSEITLPVAAFGTLRGDGLVKVERALHRLEGDPLGLDLARGRFSHSPPPYSSNPSGTTTRSASPELPPDEQREWEQREERFRRWRKLMDERSASHPLSQFDHQAIETIEKRWVEQGIWNDGWDKKTWRNVKGWKHEEPLELESESETDIEVDTPPLSLGIFGTLLERQKPKPRRPKSDENKKTNGGATSHESANGEGADAANINTRAYENMNNIWTKRGLWSGKWGILPGMSWKHEEPLEEDIGKEWMALPVDPFVPINQSPPPAASNYCQASGQVLGPSKEKLSQKDGQTQPAANLCLGPVHSSKISKVTRKKMPGPQGRSNPREVSSGVDATELQPSPDRMTPRRSKRIQLLIPNVAKDLAKTASTDPTKRAARSKAKRNIATKGSAKPQGISKKQPPKTTRGKAKKE